MGRQRGLEPSWESVRPGRGSSFPGLVWVSAVHSAGMEGVETFLPESETPPDQSLGEPQGIGMVGGHCHNGTRAGPRVLRSG